MRERALPECDCLFPGSGVERRRCRDAHRCGSRRRGRRRASDWRRPQIWERSWCRRAIRSRSRRARLRVRVARRRSGRVGPMPQTGATALRSRRVAPRPSPAHDDVVEGRRDTVHRPERFEDDRDGGARFCLQHLAPADLVERRRRRLPARGQSRPARLPRAAPARRRPSVVAPEVEQPAGDDVALHFDGAAVDRRRARVQVLEAPARRHRRRRPSRRRREASGVRCRRSSVRRSRRAPCRSTSRRRAFRRPRAGVGSRAIGRAVRAVAGTRSRQFRPRGRRSVRRQRAARAGGTSRQCAARNTTSARTGGCSSRHPTRRSALPTCGRPAPQRRRRTPRRTRARR